jgi:peptide deformylase
MTLAILPIRILGDPALREQTRPVERFDASLRRLVEDMLETMYSAPGVGLAAPQVGVSSRFFVYDDGETGPSFLANAELVQPEGDLVHDEGCLSIPGPFHPTSRAASITARGLDLEGREIEVHGEELLARILQHEADHCDGVLFIDRLDEAARRDVMRQLREHELRRAAEEARSVP